jgi:hypothetical protein
MAKRSARAIGAPAADSAVARLCAHMWTSGNRGGRLIVNRRDAVPALLRNWWPMMSFILFKSPAEGRTHIFRPGEPFAQVIIIPEEVDFELVEM